MVDMISAIRKYIEQGTGKKCKCIIFAGSRKQGGYHKNSDWDFYIVLDNPHIEKLHKNIVSYRGEVIDLFCVDDATFRNHAIGKASKDKAGLYMLAEGEIKYCMDQHTTDIIDLLKTAKMTLLQGPDCSESSLDAYKRSVAQRFRAIMHELDALVETTKVSYIHYPQIEAMVSIAKNLYSLNCKWLPKPKYVDQAIEGLDMEAHKLYTSVYDDTQPQQRIHRIIKLINHLDNKHRLGISQANGFQPDPPDESRSHKLNTPEKLQELGRDLYKLKSGLKSLEALKLSSNYLFARSIWTLVSIFYDLNKRDMPVLSSDPIANPIEADIKQIDGEWHKLYQKACTSRHGMNITHVLTMIDYLVDKHKVHYKLPDITQ